MMVISSAAFRRGLHGLARSGRSRLAVRQEAWCDGTPLPEPVHGWTVVVNTARPVELHPGPAGRRLHRGQK
ncbi:MAG TPA: hypothetical protein VIM10_17340 [Actinopolymorphaceae bacterium]